MANKVLVGEVYGGPAELQAELDTKIAGVTPIAGSDVIVTLSVGPSFSRYVINYRGEDGSTPTPTPTLDVQDFYGSTVASIAAAGSTGASDILTLPNDCDYVGIQLHLTGNASTAGTYTATAYVVGSLDGANFESVGTPVSVTIVAGAVNSNIILIDTRVVKYLRVRIVSNGDAGYAITDVNVRVIGY